MLYKPNYCCNCSEKIERIEWNMLTSRRFCGSCAVENRRYDYGVRILVASGMLAIVFGIGNLWGSGGGKQQMTSVVPVAAGTDEHPAPTAFANTVRSGPRVAISMDPSDAIANSNSPGTALEGKSERSINSKFYCGALTKKGTPCSRKVRTKGARCYQHEGKPAAPPQN